MHANALFSLQFKIKINISIRIHSTLYSLHSAQLHIYRYKFIAIDLNVIRINNYFIFFFQNFHFIFERRWPTEK